MSPTLHELTRYCRPVRVSEAYLRSHPRIVAKTAERRAVLVMRGTRVVEIHVSRAVVGELAALCELLTLEQPTRRGIHILATVVVKLVGRRDEGEES